MTFRQMSDIKASDLQKLSKDTFHCIVLDDAHTARRMIQNNLGAVFERLKGDDTAIFAYTGTPAYNALSDYIGLLKLLERDHWYDTDELNLFETSLDGKKGATSNDRVASWLRSGTVLIREKSPVLPFAETALGVLYPSQAHRQW